MKAVLLLVLAAVAFAQINPAATFCGKWTIALGLPNTAASQQTLLGLVVNRTILGCSVVGGCGFATTGLLGLPLNAKYFNGSAFATSLSLPNYVTDGAALATLSNKLINFFGFALGCTIYMASLSPPYVPANMYQVHNRLMIDGPTFAEFIGTYTASSGTGLLGALAGSGVALDFTPQDQSEIAYLSALVGALGSVPVTCNAAAGLDDPCLLSVCGSGAGCPPAKGFAQLVNVQSTAWGNGLDPRQTTQNVQIPVGGSVNWRFGGNVHTVIQTESDGVTIKTGGWGVPLPVSALKNTFTHTFDTAGTYYFKCGVHDAMHGFVMVGSGVAGLTASLSVLAAAIVAAKALML
jgi:plastocyanin